MFSLASITKSLKIFTPVFTVAFSPKNLATLFPAISRDWLMVEVVLANSLPILSPCERRPLTITSVVNLPWAAIFLSSPMPTPRESARAIMSRFPCSFTELNSSPRRAPDAMPCASCIIALLASSADAPDTTKP